jgi:proteasome accessory factor C
MTDTAAVQLRRILALIPHCADDKPHSIKELAKHAGTTPEVLIKDVRVLAERFDDPAAFVEAVQIFLEPDRLQVHSDHFLRPMRLTARELAALELGLSLLSNELPPEEQPAVSGARNRLESALARLPQDQELDDLKHADAGSSADSALLGRLRRAYRERRKVRIAYQKAQSETAAERVACPFAILFASGQWYLVGHCDDVDEIRVFRVDRIQELEALEDRFERPDTFQVSDVFRDGRAFASATAEKVRIRFAPRVARWIAEREGNAPEVDGTYTQVMPLADLDWLVRYVLQYGAEAEVLEPESAREAVVLRLRGIATAPLGVEEAC